MYWNPERGQDFMDSNTRQGNATSQAMSFNSLRHLRGREGPLTARLRMETGLSLEVKSTCTSPVLGSSISPPSPATLDLSPTSTSAAATSNCIQANARIQEKTVDIAAEFVLLHGMQDGVSIACLQREGVHSWISKGTRALG